MIQIFTKKGLDGFKPYVGIGYGSYNTSNFQSGIRGGNDQTTYAINFSTINSDGFSAFVPNSANAANSINLDKDGYKNYSLSSSLNHKINHDYEINLQYFLSKGKNQFDNRYADSSPSFHGNYKNEIKLETYAFNIKGQINKVWQSSIKLSQSSDKYLDLQKFNSSIPPWGQDDANLNDLYKTTQDQFPLLQGVPRCLYRCT